MMMGFGFATQDDLRLAARVGRKRPICEAIGARAEVEGVVMATWYYLLSAQLLLTASPCTLHNDRDAVLL
jgi:hypothetical protein